MRKYERDGRYYCVRGHRLGGDTLYTEPSGRERCRECATTDRLRQRRDKERRTGEADLAVKVARQTPSPHDIERATERWRTGDAAAAVRAAGIGPAAIARVTGVHVATASSWLDGRSTPQKRYRAAAAQVLLAVGVMRSDDPQPATDTQAGQWGDAMLVIGWGNTLGPWHASPPHPGVHLPPEARRGYLDDPDRPRAYCGYVPSVGLIRVDQGNLLDRYAAAHGYDDADVEGWYPDRDPPPKGWIVYQWALAAGDSCIPGCARCAAVRHGHDHDEAITFPECPEDCPQCAAEGLAEMREKHWAEHSDGDPEPIATATHAT